jgi:prolipoprotein diacylglyceryltransferase
LSGILTIIFAILGPCTLASKFVARWVEKKRHTFSVAGASFVGLLISPAAVIAANMVLDRWTGITIPVMAALSALAIAYALGEGIGRLACISFGCCYGRPLADLPPPVRRVFRNRAFVFSGETKKISYAHGLEGTEVVPVQAITAVLYCLSALTGMYLFLNGYPRAAFLQALIVTQLWRFTSEFLRADYRGGGTISAYQVMGLLSIPYALVAVLVFPVPAGDLPNLSAGLTAMWNPLVLITLQALWLLIFLYTGRSQVTAATLSFHVVRNRI